MIEGTVVSVSPSATGVPAMPFPCQCPETLADAALDERKRTLGVLADPKSMAG